MSDQLNFVDYLQRVKDGLEIWKEKPHNAKWWKRIDGTPIPNDLCVCIAERLASQPAPAVMGEDERELPPLMLEWQRIAHSSGWPEEAQRLIDDILSALLAFVDPHVKVGHKWIRERRANER